MNMVNTLTVRLYSCTIMQISNHLATAKRKNSCTNWSRVSGNEEKCALFDYNRGMLVSTRWASLNISKMLISWHFHTKQLLESTQNGAKNKKVSCVLRAQKHLVDERAQRKITRLFFANRKSTVTL